MEYVIDAILIFVIGIAVAALGYTVGMLLAG